MKTKCCAPNCEHNSETDAMFAVLDPDYGDEFHLCFIHMKAIINRYEFMWRRTNDLEHGVRAH